MNIIITLAGHSRRFKKLGYTKPKFLLEIESKPIISRIVDMFSPEDTFHFILNDKQKKEYPEIPITLKLLAKKVFIHIINRHEKGPIFSLLGVSNRIPDEEEVIISYCDFLIDWDYKKFLREINGYDGAIPSFKGFHPASFGHNYYAYMKVNNKNEMLCLKEKSSFTDKRHEEPASTGIYYFKNWKIFKEYAKNFMDKKANCSEEGYVSLLFNSMAYDGLKILVSYVKKFICLGTPEDLEQYLFWSKYFNRRQQFESRLGISQGVNLIPIAGKGNRFKKYGYRISKPLIQIQKDPMVVRACDSFPNSNNWIFIALKKDLDRFPIEKTLSSNFKNSRVLSVNYETSGQLATCLLAKNEIDKNSSLFIASADYETLFSWSKWQDVLENEEIDVAIWTCRMKGKLIKDPKAFAYCKTENPKSNVVTKVIEKNVISDNPSNDNLVVGSFWFRRASLFFTMANQVIERDLSINGEHYIGNGINLIIAAGKKVVIFDIDQWISYGDPFELDIFFYWEEFFEKRHKSCI